MVFVREVILQAGKMLRDEGTVVGIAFDGDATQLPYGVFRFRALRFVYPSVLTRRLFETSVHLVASGRVQLRPLIGCVLEGIEQVPEAFLRTAHKSRYGLINPAQVAIHAGGS